MGEVLALQADHPALGLLLPSNTSFDHWKAIGRTLCLSSQALNWHIGDWWAFGEHSYGIRAATAAEGIFGKEFQTLVDLATVARRFETTRRRVGLSFTHHREVAPLPSDVADMLLDRAEREQLSTRDLRQEAQQFRQDSTVRPIRAAKCDQLEAIVGYEIAVEFGKALKKLRPLTKRESKLLSEAREYLDRAGPKWPEREIQVLRDWVEEDQWLSEVRKLLPHHTDAALRGRMQRLREELGISEPHDSYARFQSNAVNGSKRLLEATRLAGNWQ